MTGALSLLARTLICIHGPRALCARFWGQVGRAGVHLLIQTSFTLTCTCVCVPVPAACVRARYLDQPYCTIWANATVHRWVCTITRNSLPEGNVGEHAEVQTVRSFACRRFPSLRPPPTNPHPHQGHPHPTPLHPLLQRWCSECRAGRRRPPTHPHSLPVPCTPQVLYSDDMGSTWVTGIRLEPPEAVTNAYGVIAQSLAGTLYILYNRNSNNITHLPGSNSR